MAPKAGAGTREYAQIRAAESARERKKEGVLSDERPSELIGVSRGAINIS